MTSGKTSAPLRKLQLPKMAASIVRKWHFQHRIDLMENWVHAQHFEPIEGMPEPDHDD